MTEQFAKPSLTLPARWLSPLDSGRAAGEGGHVEDVNRAVAAGDEQQVVADQRVLAGVDGVRELIAKRRKVP